MNKTIAALSKEFDAMTTQIESLKCENADLRSELHDRPVAYLNEAICDGKAWWARTPFTFGSAIAEPIYPKRPLGSLSWSEIAAIGKSGYAAKILSLGDIKTIHSSEIGDIVVRIIGFNHDTQSTGEIAPISFEMEHILPEEMPMNEEGTNKGGWAQSYVRKFLNEEMFDKLPNDLRNVIKPVVKLTSKGGGSKEMESTIDLLWVKSEQELFGRKVWSVGGEGKWYEYYKQENVPYFKRTADGDNAWPWLRSPRGSDATSFCGVNSSGNASDYHTSGSFGAAFGFCV